MLRGFPPSVLYTCFHSCCAVTCKSGRCFTLVLTLYVAQNAPFLFFKLIFLIGAETVDYLLISSQISDSGEHQKQVNYKQKNTSDTVSALHQGDF